MKVDVHFHAYNVNEGSARRRAAEWMQEQYEKYGNKIISSNFAEDNNSVTAYIIVTKEPLIKL